MVIIGISGWARSGKDTIADYMVKTHGFKKLSFGQAVKDSLYALNPGSLKEAVDKDGWDIVKQDPEVRRLLQRMGTEVGRNLYGEDFWVNQTFKNIESEDYDFVIPDVRFKSEANEIKKRGGVIIRVSRSGVVAPNDHISEHDLDNYKFDAIIENNGSLDELYEKVER